jgi:hypothetical protein
MHELEREELRENYLKERMTVVNKQIDRQTILGKENMNKLPRHMVNCNWFSECPIDFKCRAYNPTYIRCQNCILAKKDLICRKKRLHCERNLNRMITRPFIDLDKKEDSYGL